MKDLWEGLHIPIRRLITDFKDSWHFAGTKKLLLSRYLSFYIFKKMSINTLFKLHRFEIHIKDLMSKISKRVTYFLQESLKLCAHPGSVVCGGPWSLACVLVY